MKLVLILVSAIMLTNSCKTQDKTTSNTQESSNTMQTSDSLDTIVTLQSNSSYDIMEDSIDKYYIVNKAGANNVFEYTLIKKPEEGLADSEYKETVQFEFSDNMLPMSLSNEELSKVKLITSKQCKCRDAGYYKVMQGNLSVSKKGNVYAVSLVFEVDGLDQKLSKINTTVN